MKPTSFLIKTGIEEANLPNYRPVYSDERCSLYVNTYNDKHIQYVCDDEGFNLFIGEVTRKPTSNFALSTPPGQGTFIKYKKETGQIVITTDRLGSVLVYYCKDQANNLEVSNRLDNLSTDEKNPDWPAIQQYLNTGYTIGSSTFFLEVKQTLPNQTLTASSKHAFHIESTTLEPDKTKSMVPYTDEELIDILSERVSTVLREHIPSVLMMSAGWDSRTLLMSGTQNYLTAYTHGDLSSREVSISRGLTGGLRMDHVFSDVRNLDLSSDLLDVMIEELGFCVFPVWYIAGQRAQSTYNAPLSSGVLGEFLGGHYGLLSMGTRLQKMLASASLLNARFIRDEQFSAALERFATPARDHWFLSTEGRDLLADTATSTKTIIQKKLDSELKRTGSWQSAIEAFNMEHRARQYILKQAQAASSTSGYIAPFADDRIAEIIQQIPFDNRVHNKLNQKLLKSNHPKLLDYSMAATLIPAKHPIFFQELSRGARIFFEQCRKLSGLSQPKLGWFNYEHLYQTNILNTITDSLTSTLWDKNRMHSTLERNPENSIDAGSTLDMLCKLKTIDYYLKAK